jgi:DNA recombination protein RmuC
MLSEPTTYVVVALAIANLALIGWVLLLVKSSNAGPNGLATSLAGRFDGIDRNAEVLRRALTEMDQALRGEIGKGARDGLAAAFDKVQEGTKAQADELGTFGRELASKLENVQLAISRFGGNVTSALGESRDLVTAKLAEAETRAADGRAALARETSDAVARAREAIDASLKMFGDQQRERLLHAEQAVREGKEAVEVSSAKTEKTLGDQREAITGQLSQSAAEISQRLGKELGELADRVRTGFDGFSERLREQQEQLREKVETKLEEIRTGNETKLDKISRAVDEQLQSALGERLDDSFKRVTEQFAQVQQAIGQVQTVAGQIGDLKRLFSNVKMRGGIGEGHLRALLDDFLPPGAYEANLRVAETGEIVEYAIRIPVKGSSGDKWLAIDSKFPTADYERLVQASECNDRDQEIAARKALERTIREEARRISTKYIRPPQTLEYAIMYLPSEGLDGEVARMPGLIENLRRQFAIHVMGPRVLPAHLHIIRVGYLTLALEQKAGAIGEILAAVKAEWSKLGDSLDALARRADTLNKGIKQTQQRTRMVGRTLKTVDALDFERAEQVLGLSEEALLIEAEANSDDDIPIMAPTAAAIPLDSERRDAAE